MVGSLRLNAADRVDVVGGPVNDVGVGRLAAVAASRPQAIHRLLGSERFGQRRESHQAAADPWNAKHGWQRAPGPHRHQQRRAGLRAHPIFQQLGHAANRRRFDQYVEGQSLAELGLDLDEQLDRQQRVAPQFGERVGHADRPAIECPLPDFDQPAFHCIGRWLMRGRQREVAGFGWGEHKLMLVRSIAPGVKSSWVAIGSSRIKGNASSVPYDYPCAFAPRQNSPEGRRASCCDFAQDHIIIGHNQKRPPLPPRT